MAKRSENMLEAFKASTAPVEEPPGKPAEPSRGAGGPFAPPPAPRAPRPPRSQRQPEGLALPANPAGIAMMVGLVLLLAMAFLLGRLSAPSVQASAPVAEDEGFRFPALPEGRETARGASSPETTLEVSEGQTEADRAFLDPANKFSIRVLEYRRTERDEVLAFAAYDHLRAKGFPVVWPRHKGNSLFVFVGAAPRQSDLDGLLRELWKTPGPGRDAKPFDDAFVVNIADNL